MKISEIEVDRQLESKPANKTQLLLRDALALLGNGKTWVRFQRKIGNSFCAIGALSRALHGHEGLAGTEQAHAALNRAALELGVESLPKNGVVCGASFAFVNLNNYAPDFRLVRQMFERADEIAGKE